MSDKEQNDIEENEVIEPKESTEEETLLGDEEREAQSLEDEPSIEEDSVESLQKRLDETEDRYIRVHAEFENIKKRLEKEKYQAIEYASEKFAKDLLPVLDSLVMAIDAVNNSSEASGDDLLKNLHEGVELTLKQFLSTLEKHGIKQVDTDGELDPNVHEAVMKVDNEDVQSGHIAQVMQQGYRYKERTLRAAMVSVAN